MFLVIQWKGTQNNVTSNEYAFSLINIITLRSGLKQDFAAGYIGITLHHIMHPIYLEGRKIHYRAFY